MKLAKVALVLGLSTVFSFAQAASHHHCGKGKVYSPESKTCVAQHDCKDGHWDRKTKQCVADAKPVAPAASQAAE